MAATAQERAIIDRLRVELTGLDLSHDAVAELLVLIQDAYRPPGYPAGSLPMSIRSVPVSFTPGPSTLTNSFWHMPAGTSVDFTARDFARAYTDWRSNAVAQMTASEAAQRAFEDERSREQEREYRQSCAQRRARIILQRHLTPAQRRSFRANSNFAVRGNLSGATYNITNLHAIRETDGHHFCLEVVDGAVPWDDVLLVRKLLIENDEQRFLDTANDLTRMAEIGCAIDEGRHVSREDRRYLAASLQRTREYSAGATARPTQLRQPAPNPGPVASREAILGANMARVTRALLTGVFR